VFHYFDESKEDTIIMQYTRLVNFTVVADGDEYGSCVTDDWADTGEIQYNTEGLQDVFDGFGNTWTSNIIFVILMVIVAGALLFSIGTGRSFGSISKESHGWLFGIIFFVEGLLTILGVWIGALSPLWLAVFGLVIVVPAGIKIYQYMTGGSR